MDRSNLKLLSIISSALFIAACASAPPSQKQEEASLAAEQQVTAAEEKVEQVVADEKEAMPEQVEEIVEETQAMVEETVAEEKTAVSEVVEEVVEEAPPAVAPAPVADEPVKPVEKAPAKLNIPTDPNTFLVTSGPKDGDHPYFGVGDRRGFLVNGEQGKTLVLTRGEEYTFDVKTGVKHDFYFSTSERGWGAGTITDGITGQFTYDGEVTVKPNPATPKVMYYQCRNHKNMGGKIHVINKGEKVNIEKTAVAAKDNKPAFKVTEQQVKQKRAYAKMLMSSGTAKRILDSGNVEAQDLKGKANSQLTKADKFIADGKNVEAMAAVDEALRLINAASRLAPGANSTPEVDYKAQYGETLAEIEGYEKSYQKNLKQSGGKVKAKLDEQKFDGLMAKAKKLAAANNYKDAMKPLGEASKMMTDVIQVMLDDVVIVYDKNFATPKEEYEYEFARYESYVELVPIAKEQKRPPPRMLKMMDTYVDKGASIAAEGAEIAKDGDYKRAIQAYQAATDNVRRALMLIGVR